MKISNDLTLKQEAFCLAYLQCGNASEAYRRAFAVGGMKDTTVNRRAFDLVRNGKIRARIRQLRKEAADAALLSEAKVLQEVARIGFIDPGEMFDEKGRLLPIDRMAPDVRAAVASYEIREILVEGEVVGHLKKVKLWNKNDALEKLMKHLGMFDRDNHPKGGLFDQIPLEILEMIIKELQELLAMNPETHPVCTNR